MENDIGPPVCVFASEKEEKITRKYIQRLEKEKNPAFGIRRLNDVEVKPRSNFF